MQDLIGGGYDLVIADQAMRGIDASTFAAWVQAHTRELWDKIVFVTTDIGAERPTLPAGVTARYVQKPLDADALLTAVRDVLRSRV